jgi:hypothetical protein
VLDREEINPQYRGRYHFFDSENNNKDYRKNIDRDISAAYKAALKYVTERIENAAASRGGKYKLVCSDESMDKVFLLDFVDMEVVK